MVFDGEKRGASSSEFTCKFFKEDNINDLRWSELGKDEAKAQSDYSRCYFLQSASSKSSPHCKLGPVDTVHHSG